MQTQQGGNNMHNINNNTEYNNTRNSRLSNNPSV